MGVSGNLRTMTLPDVLQWIGVNRKTGVLELERGGKRRGVAFREGTIVACGLDDPVLLGHFLLSAGQVRAERLLEAAERQARSGKTLAEVLVEKQWILPSRLRETVAAQAEEIVYGLFDWIDANFTFRDHAAPGDDYVEARLAVDEILLNGLQRLDETKMIRKVFHTSGIVLERTGLTPPQQIANSGMARRILQSIDGDRTLAAVLRHAQASEFLVLKFLYHLYHKDVLRITETRPVAADAATLVDELPPDEADTDRETAPAAFAEAGDPRLDAPTDRAAGTPTPEADATPPPEVADEVVQSLADLARQLSGGLGEVPGPRPAAPAPPPVGGTAEPPRAAPPPDAEPASPPVATAPAPGDLGAETQIRMAEHLLAHGEDDAARQLLIAARRLAPDHPALSALIEQVGGGAATEAELPTEAGPPAEMAPSGVLAGLDRERVPVVVEMPGADLPSECELLLALIDGQSTIGQLLGVCPFSDGTVLELLERLVARGIVTLR